MSVLSFAFFLIALALPAFVIVATLRTSGARILEALEGGAPGRAAAPVVIGRARNGRPITNALPARPAGGLRRPAPQRWQPLAA